MMHVWAFRWTSFNISCMLFVSYSVLFVCEQGQSTYSRQIKQVEDDIQQLLKKINELTGKCAVIVVWGTSFVYHYVVKQMH